MNNEKIKNVFVLTIRSLGAVICSHAIISILLYMVVLTGVMGSEGESLAAIPWSVYSVEFSMGLLMITVSRIAINLLTWEFGDDE